MSRRPNLELGDELMVRKGEAAGVAPAIAIPTPPEPSSAPPQPRQEFAPQGPAPYDRPVVVGRRATIERVFTNVRIPKDLDERLFRVLVETRRTKQDIIETFIREGLDRWESSRAGPGA
jgi:hypothetical protein